MRGCSGHKHLLSAVADLHFPPLGATSEQKMRGRRLYKAASFLAFRESGPGGARRTCWRAWCVALLRAWASLSAVADLHGVHYSR